MCCDVVRGVCGGKDKGREGENKGGREIEIER